MKLIALIKIIKDMKNKNIGVTNEDIEDWKTSIKSIKKKGIKKANNTKPKYRQIASFAKNQDKISNIVEKHKNVKNTVDDIIKSIRKNNKSNVGNSSVVSTTKDSTKIIFYLKNKVKQ